MLQLEEAKEEVELEDLVLTEIVEPTIEEGCQEVAMEILNHYGNKVQKQQLRQVSVII